MALRCYFDKIKKDVAANGKYCAESYCVGSARLMVKLLTGEEAKSTPTASVKNQDFFQKSTNGSYTSPFVQRLFDQSPSSEHLVFHISLPEDIHDFVIYKECNGSDIGYRVIQSSLGRYSLGTWLGVSYYPPGFEDWDDYQEFGDGKKVNADQILKFLKVIFEHFGQEGLGITNANIYTIPPKFTQAYQTEQKTHQTEQNTDTNAQSQLKLVQIRSLIESRLAFDYYQKPSILPNVATANPDIVRLLLGPNVQ